MTAASFMPGHATQRNGDFAGAFVYALLVHVFIIGLLLISFRWQTPARPVVQVIQAKVMQDVGVAKEVERLKQQNEKLPQESEATNEAEPPKKKIEKLPQDDQAARQKELQQRIQVEADRKKQLELKKQEAETRRREVAEKQRQEQQKKDADQRRKQAESALKEQLAAEEKERGQARAAADTARAQGEIARFEALIRQKVERNWQRPSNVQQGMQCTVRVRLIPGGEVLQAVVIRSSGNALFDRSAENAVYKASPLPVPEDKALFDYFREFEFKFRPEG